MNSLRVLTPRGTSFLLLGLLTLASGVILGYPDLTRIGAVLTVLPLMAMLLTRRRAPRLAVTRSVIPHRLHPDQRGVVEASFRNVGTRRTPLYLAQEQLDIHLGDRPRFVLYPLDRGETRTLRYEVRSTTRGAYRLGPLSLRQRDPFGLTYVAVRLSSSTEIVVLPRVFEVGDDAPPAQGRGSEGERPQMIALHGEDDVNIRNYRNGDELRRVHWPATAHRGELMVRQEDRPARRRAVLVLDSRGSAHGRPPQPSPSFEYAISALASAAKALIARGYVVHLLSAQTVREGSAAHPMEYGSILDSLARAQRDGDLDLGVVAGAAHAFTSGGVLAVAAVVGHDAEEIRHLAAIREHGSTAIAFVLDRSSFGGSAHLSASAESRGLNDAGWTTVVCTPTVGIGAAWSQLHRRSSSGATR